MPSDRGICCQVYRSGRPLLSDSLGEDDPLASQNEGDGEGVIKSVLVVPVIVGDSVCGVIELANHSSGTPYSARDKELLRIFATYISSSIQYALGAGRGRARARGGGRAGRD